MILANRFTFTVRCSKRNPSNCWDMLRPVAPQHSDEIGADVMVTKVEKSDWMAQG